MRPLELLAEDMNASTAGCFATIAAAACWWRTISSNEISCAASRLIFTSPVSSVGMKPRGSSQAHTPVSTARIRAVATVTGLCRMLNASVRR